MGGKGGEGEGDAFAKSKKQRRLANKVAREKKLNQHVGVHHVIVPVEEQSVDLGTGGEGGGGGEGERDALKRAMRGARRQGIKEKNFLRGMR